MSDLVVQKKSDLVAESLRIAQIPKPKTSAMVLDAISTLSEKGGSSLQAIKKYIAAKYNIDSNARSYYIKKYLKTAVETGELIQSKGKGAAGSFKIAAKLKADVKPPKSPKMKASANGVTKGPIKVVSLKKVTAVVVKKPKTIVTKTATKPDNKSSKEETTVSKAKTVNLPKPLSKTTTKPKKMAISN